MRYEDRAAFAANHLSVIVIDGRGYVPAARRISRLYRVGMWTAARLRAEVLLERSKIVHKQCIAITE